MVMREDLKKQEEKKMKRFPKVMALTAIAAFVIVSSGFAAWKWPWQKAQRNVLSVQGSTTVLPITQKAAEEYMKINKDIDISIRGGGSGVGIAGIIDGSTDIGNSSRSIKAREIMTAKQKGVNPVGTIIAQDALAIVVHPSNLLRQITISQLKDIYSGKITKWSQLGGPDEMIVPVSRDTSSGTYEIFAEFVLKGVKLRTDSIMTVSNREVAETVKNTKGAIGYVGLAFLSPELKVVEVEGVIPSNETVRNGSYKLTRPLLLFTNGEPAGKAKDYIDFILSPAGQKVVVDAGYVPVK